MNIRKYEVSNQSSMMVDSHFYLPKVQRQNQCHPFFSFFEQNRNEKDVFSNTAIPEKMIKFCCNGNNNENRIVFSIITDSIQESEMDKLCNEMKHLTIVDIKTEIEIDKLCLRMSRLTINEHFKFY